MTLKDVLELSLSASAIAISVISIYLTIRLQKKQFDIELFDRRIQLLDFYSNFDSKYIPAEIINHTVVWHLETHNTLVNIIITNDRLAKCFFPKETADKIIKINNYIIDYIIKGDLSSFENEYNAMLERDKELPENINFYFIRYIHIIIDGIYPTISLIKKA